jgi:hypothetical protein
VPVAEGHCEVSPTGDKKKPSATRMKEFKKSRTFAIFLTKKIEKKGRICQI